MNSIPFDAVLFDCDGVLVDSEPITNRVLAEMLGELGWQSRWRSRCASSPARRSRTRQP